MLFEGLKFGLLLQLAVGPVCLLVFNTASSQGFGLGLVLTAAVTLVDALYIALAGLGITSILNNERVKRIVKILGFLVLLIFGLNNIGGAFAWQVIPDIKLFATHSDQGVFLQGLIITLSNPLTIIFWGGIFSAQILERNLNRSQLLIFACGCILATLLFLSLIALVGSMIHRFISAEFIKLLNAAVGLLLIYFGFKLLRK